MGGVVEGMANAVDLTASDDDDEGSRPVDLTASDEEGSSPADLAAVADVENFTSPTVIDDLPPDFWMAVANRMRGHRTACKLHQVSRTARDGVSKSEVWRRLADKRGLVVDDPDDTRHIKSRYARHLTERGTLLKDLGDLGENETHTQEAQHGLTVPYFISKTIRCLRHDGHRNPFHDNTTWSKVLNFEAPLARLILKRVCVRPMVEGSGIDFTGEGKIDYDATIYERRGCEPSPDHVVVVSAVLTAVYTCVVKPFSRVILMMDSYHVDFALTMCRQLLPKRWIISAQSIDDDDGSPTVVEIALLGSSTLVISNFECCIDVGAEMDATAAIEVDTGVDGLPVGHQGVAHARWLARYDHDAQVSETLPEAYTFCEGKVGIPFITFQLDDEQVFAARRVRIMSWVEHTANPTAAEAATVAATTT